MQKSIISSSSVYGPESKAKGCLFFSALVQRFLSKVNGAFLFDGKSSPCFDKSMHKYPPAFRTEEGYLAQKRWKLCCISI